jgi:adenosylcobinamide-GDP ribazoletransferase
MNQELRLFLTAVQFFTRIPVPASVGHSAEQLDGATRYFPLVGIIVGAAAAIVLALATLRLPLGVAVLLSMLASVMITGAFHEDGLADSADGLYGGWTVQDRLRIMKDSRSGVFGVLALILVLGLKYASLCALGWPAAACALLFAHPFSRCCAVWVMQRLPYVREDETSRAKPIARSVSPASLAIASLTALLPAALLAWWWRNPLAVLAGVAAALLALGFMLRQLGSKLGGYTGDGLGATQQLSEIAIYIGLLAALRG